MHTTASDGKCTPEELVQRAHEAGIQTMSVTDHDTMGAVARATQAAEAFGMTVVPGIEITSVHDGKDVHMLAYFLSESTPGLMETLARQRHLRVERAREIARKLAAMGAPIDVQALVETASAPGGKALARPQIAQALITAGHVTTVAEAFERFLSEESPAYVPHQGASPVDIVRLVQDGGGLAAVAHPGYRPRDEIIAALVDAGMPAIEVFHSSHDAASEAHYLAIAARHGLLVTGGSDYHGPGTRRSEFFGVTNLPREHYDKLAAYAAGRHTTAGRTTA
jgi:predicted metal-dependent phosphoesterase TrpH